MTLTRTPIAISTLFVLIACGDDDHHDASDVADAADASPDTSLPEVTPDVAPEVVSEVATWDRARHPWPMFGGDPQRSGRSPYVGPTAYTPGAPENWTYAASGGASINMQPTISDGAIYFGTWGLLRGAATTDPATSKKSDGRYYGLRADGTDIFAPVEPGPLAACYAYPTESVAPTDKSWCGTDANLHVTWYNGTIEGSGLVDPWTGTHYVGRGDGRLYAINPATGAVEWQFVTFDPVEPTHPDGGGEIVGGATMGPDGTIYFSTFGMPWPGNTNSPPRETQAIYAVDRKGDLVWRHPANDASLDNPVTAAVALSPDGTTLYVGTWLLDSKVPGLLLALDTQASDPAKRVRWSLTLENTARPLKPDLWVRHVSVGADGTIYLGAAEARVLGSAAAVVAVSDQGTTGEIRWIAEPHGYAEAMTTLVQGIALDDRVVFASTGDVRDFNGREGLLAALDPASGETLASFDPGDDAPGSMTGPLVDSAGHVYVGTRGRHDLAAAPFAAGSQWRRGVVFGLAWHADDRRFEELWRLPIDALLDWATPAIDADGALYVGSTAPLPTKRFEDIWEPLTGVPPRTTPSLYRIVR